MVQFIMKVLVALFTSFYFFPFQFSFLPMGYNTKKVMAVVGLGILLVQLAKKSSFAWNKDIIFISVAAMVVSLIGLCSVVGNDTFDYTYASYIMSMWVWLGGAYTVVSLMRCVHGYVSVRLLADYLVAVCVGQCVLALAIDFYAPLQNFINSIYSDGDYFVKHKRLYGLGANLDVAGLRFSAVLVMMTVLLVKWNAVMKKQTLAFYLVSFLVIAVIGNMIARTTTVGVALSFLYVIYVAYSSGEEKLGSLKNIWKWVLGVFVLGLPVIVYLYYQNAVIHDHIRFAFEGFFSLVEKGTWEVHSNDRLEMMVVFPETLKTWIIGDGYFNSPMLNPYFTGVNRTEYYMGTDIGYLRFIFYFGVIGLLAFMYYFILVTNCCMKRFLALKQIFVMLLLVNFIVWFKVATDIFLVFALFLCISKEEEDEAEQKELAAVQESF